MISDLNERIEIVDEVKIVWIHWIETTLSDYARFRTTIMGVHFRSCPTDCFDT